MGSQKYNALLLHRENESLPFRKKLIRVLDALRCSTKSVTRWSKAREDLEGNVSRYQFVVLDPAVKGYDSQTLQDIWAAMGRRQRPMLVLLNPACGQAVPDPKEEPSNLSAVIREDNSLYEIAFILNRILFRQNMGQREFPRAYTQFNVEFARSSEPNARTGQALNLSVGGFFLHTEVLNPERTFLHLNLMLPDGYSPIECSGKVAYTHFPDSSQIDLFPPGMGIQFKGINDVDQSRIGKFVCDRLLRIDQKAFEGKEI
ncbi:MAG TPA: PilZ domain-containing protein [Bdellovibrionota bacterium]|nr:PilZ domain-containing protein [Bdellovibrionota bacterium]